MHRIALAAIALLLATTAQAQTVQGRIPPERPWLEPTEFGQALNFDLAVTNTGAHAVELTELEVTFVAPGGRPILTRRLDGNGTAPSIQILPGRTLEPGAERLIFNPFEYAPTGPVVSPSACAPSSALTATMM